jgi:tripartite-type tricarboxylate transporter receptor subunit TctC
VAFARSRPGKLNWSATAGALHYIVPGFLKSVGLDLTLISYREIAPALQDLAEARIHLYVSALASQLGMVRSGSVRVIAITNRERSALVPEAETSVEAGFADLALEGFLGFSHHRAPRRICSTGSERTSGRSAPIPRSTRAWQAAD